MDLPTPCLTSLQHLSSSRATHTFVASRGNRTVGQHASVHVWNSSFVDFAALWADVGCGNGTKLIYYMSAGEVLSREFTSKDTHSPRGDLIVS